MKSDQLKIEIGKLNRRSTVERALDDFFIACLVKDVEFESPYKATKELLERYMAVVRSRNNIRRNWHPERARSCDAKTLELISKNKLRDAVSKQLHKGLVVTSNGKKAIYEESIEELASQIADSAYVSNRAVSPPSDLEKIVRRILKTNPQATSTDVINEMTSEKTKYGIFYIDETTVVIRVPNGIGKQTEDKPRSLATIKNILTRIKTTKK
jgi:hypothetical protein